MSKARVAVLEVVSGNLTVTAAARAYGLSRQHIYRLLKRYQLGGLPAIEPHPRQGNGPALASAAYTLAGTSGQLGHPEVASLCHAIAADARRGVLAHARVQHLHALVGAQP